MLNLTVFLVLSTIVIFSAIKMLSVRNVLHATYWLLLTAITAAGIIWFLGAEFIAITQLLIYAGAVGILTIFALMVTVRTEGELIRSRDLSLAAAICASAFFGLMAYAITTSPSLMRVTEYDPPTFAEFGATLFALDGWVLPFELVALVLTVALIAAVWWTREVRKGGDES
ncbi:MAG: NADH-quinone oxidoreductase subunit J [Coriobacteriia bacterium]|nr:NADH-quinone oxidoreductase subunit J [Coriobacteriia bacterium]